MFNEAALCNARKLSSLTSLPIKQAGFVHFHDFWGTCENQPKFTEDSENKPNYSPDSRSIYFLVFRALPSCFRKPGPHTARDCLPGSRHGYEPARSCMFLQLQVLGICQHRRISSCARATRRSARCLTWILLLRCVILGRGRKGSGNWELGIREMI